MALDGNLDGAVAYGLVYLFLVTVVEGGEDKLRHVGVKIASETIFHRFSFYVHDGRGQQLHRIVRRGVVVVFYVQRVVGVFLECLEEPLHGVGRRPEVGTEAGERPHITQLEIIHTGFLHSDGIKHKSFEITFSF